MIFSYMVDYKYNKSFMSDDDFLGLLNEACGCGEGDGIEVFLQNLAKIHEYSGELLGVCQGMDVEDWIEDKISKASQSLSDVKHYMEYKNSAYAAQQHGIEQHGGDVYMGQKITVAGVPSGRVEGERMPSMAAQPVMTPPSAMAGQVASAGGAGIEQTQGAPVDDMAPLKPAEEAPKALEPAPEEEEGSLLGVLFGNEEEEY